MRHTLMRLSQSLIQRYPADESKQQPCVGCRIEANRLADNDYILIECPQHSKKGSWLILKRNFPADLILLEAVAQQGQ